MKITIPMHVTESYFLTYNFLPHGRFSARAALKMPSYASSRPIITPNKNGCR